MNDLDTVLRDCLTVFDSLGIPHVVVGGLAVRLLGLPRPTFDVDLMVSIDRDRLPILLDKLDEVGFEVPEAYRSGWVDQVAGLPVVKFKLYVGGRGIDADIFLAETKFQVEVMRRSRRDEIWGIPISVVTPEDLILFKVLANRPRDQSDVLEIRLVQGDLDEDYLRRWAAELGVSDQLKAALAQPLY